MKNQSLVTQFRRTFILILIASIVATLCTYILAFFLIINSKDIYPANYYEQKIPDIETYIYESGTELLNPSNESKLKSIVPKEGMLYQVVDVEGNIIYGTRLQKGIKNRDELFKEFLNTTVIRQNYRIYTVPIEDQNGKIKGAVLLFYKIKVSFLNNKGRIVFLFAIISLLSPFLYLVGFTHIYSKIFARTINQPLQLLISAAKKIKGKDLEFEIDYYADNELGNLCSAFSEMQDELKKSLSMQWQMEQERIEMVEALAHDLKSPLSIILGYTDALIENSSVDNVKRYKYLAVIKRNAERSAEIVKEMQYTSDLETNSKGLRLVSLDLSEFLTRKIRDYELQVGEKEIEFSLTMQDGISMPILIDIDRLTRILDNVIDNSLRYTPQGGKIDIMVKAEDGYIFYVICDSGQGFTSKDLRKAFDKFYRADLARQIKEGHSGLGLYIVKHLVEQLGGEIQIMNLNSGGACIIFNHKIFDNKDVSIYN